MVTQTANKLESKKQKEHYFHYQDEQDYINQQAKQARIIKRWLFGLFIVTTLLYLYFHFWGFEGRPIFSRPFEWIQITDGDGISKRATDWLLFSTAGTIIYLLTQVATNIPAIRSLGSKKDPSFVEYSTWYWATLVKGPFIAVIILLFFYAAEFKLTGEDGSLGLSFDFSELDHRATVLLAGVLGFYSRVARSVLDNIMKSLFSKAWAEAHEEFEISPDKVEITPGSTQTFTTKPFTDVVWAASPGAVDANGVYTAPTEDTYLHSSAMVMATTKGSGNVAKSAVVKIVPFLIKGEPEIKLGSAGPYNFTLEPAPAGTVEWTMSPPECGTLDKSTGQYTPPAEGYSSVALTATVTDGDDTDKYNTINIKLVE